MSYEENVTVRWRAQQRDVRASGRT